MEHCALKIAYLGTAYCGWQVQANGLSVQRRLQDALETAFSGPVTVTGCSRTDAGVHARGFVCAVSGIPGSIPEEKIPEAVNSRLPADIAVLCAARVPDGFHPRYGAVGKEYVYRIRNSRIPDPFDDAYTVLWPTPHPLDADLCGRFCGELAGKHDYASFMASGSSVSDTVRTVRSFSCRREGDLLIFTVSADGFLYNMVRILVGTVLDLESGLLTSTPSEIIASRSRASAGRTMPAKGLCLNRVFYPEDPFRYSPLSDSDSNVI